MVDQYASFREKLPASTFTVTATSGGLLTTSGTLNFYLQLVNRAGRNLLSEPQSINYSAGQKISLTINASAIASGEEVFFLLISTSPNASSNAQQLARWVAREANQTTKRLLPTTIEFTRDSHLIRGGIVADLNSLPQGENRISGMVREVTSEQAFYIYDGELNEWIEYPLGFNTYLAITTDAGGSDRPLNEVQGALRAPPLVGGGDSTPVRAWWLNGFTESGAALPKGKRFNLRFAVDKSLIASNGLSYSEIFSGLVKVSLPGYIRRSTGVLDTTPMQSQLVWSGYYTPLTLPLDLPPGYAAAWDIVMSFSPDQLRGYLKEGSEIEIDLVEVPEAGIPSPLHSIYGNVILNNPDYFYIVPNRRKKGKAIVGGYQAGSESEQVLVGLTADTQDQQCIINGAFNGEIFVRPQGETIFATEALRAIVSTEAGMGKTTAPVSVTLETIGAIEVVVTHPNTIRSDYPDEIAGVECQVNVPHLRVFVVTQNGILRRNDPVSVGTASTTILISELSIFAPIQSIVSVGNDFCLFAPTSVIATAKTVGSISAGTYQVIVAYEYPSPNYILTKITHDVNRGCIPTLNTSNYFWRSPVRTINEAKNLPLTELINFHARIIKENDAIYYYDWNNQLENDDNAVIVTTIQPPNRTSSAFIAISGEGLNTIDCGSFDPPVIYLTDEIDNILTTEKGDLLIDG